MVNFSLFLCTVMSIGKQEALEGNDIVIVFLYTCLDVSCHTT